MGEPLYHKLGPHGTTDFCDKILQGQIKMKDLKDIPLQETKELLLQTISPFNTPNDTHPHNNKISIDIDQDDFLQIFSKWKESTTTSPSGRHLGHYKAILGSPDLIEYHCIMASLPLHFGFTPTRWSKAIQIMLEKKKQGIPSSIDLEE